MTDKYNYMKALRHKPTGEYLHQIEPTGKIVVSTIPKEIQDTATWKTVKQIEDAENKFRVPAKQVNLSEYELVEIEIVVTKVIDSNE